MPQALTFVEKVLNTRRFAARQLSVLRSQRPLDTHTDNQQSGIKGSLRRRRFDTVHESITIPPVRDMKINSRIDG